MCVWGNEEGGRPYEYSGRGLGPVDGCMGSVSMVLSS